MSNSRGRTAIALAALLLTAAPASLAFAQGAGGEPVPPQGEAVPPAQPGGGVQPAPDGGAVQPAPDGGAMPPMPNAQGAPGMSPADPGAAAPGAATPQMMPANPQAANPVESQAPVQEGGYEMAVPDNYVAEPQMNMAPQVQIGIDNNYPTVAIADYVFGCMASNGQTRSALNACSCSIDVISSIMPYDQYIEAETTLGVRQVGGEKAEIFRTQDVAENLLNLRRAQAEAEIRCF